MRPFAKAINAYYYVHRAEVNRKTFKFLYIGTNEVNVQSEISDDLDGLNLAFDEEINYNSVFLTDKFIKSIIDDFLNDFKVEDYFYKNLKKDGQFFRTFDRFFIKLYKKLKGKKSDCFKKGKIPNDEIEFLKCISDVINHRIEILSEK